MGPVTRFRLTSENRYVNGHWVVSGPYIGLGQFWIFDSQKNKKKRKKIEKTEKTGKKMAGLPAVLLPDGTMARDGQDPTLTHSQVLPVPSYQ
jgi:hypothetical protein